MNPHLLTYLLIQLPLSINYSASPSIPILHIPQAGKQHPILDTPAILPLQWKPFLLFWKGVNSQCFYSLVRSLLSSDPSPDLCPTSPVQLFPIQNHQTIRTANLKIPFPKQGIWFRQKEILERVRSVKNDTRARTLTPYSDMSKPFIILDQVMYHPRSSHGMLTGQK